MSGLGVALMEDLPWRLGFFPIYRLAMPDSKKPSKKAPALLLGVGLDSDGHQRLTKGKNFALVGGT